MSRCVSGNAVVKRRVRIRIGAAVTFITACASPIELPCCFEVSAVTEGEVQLLEAVKDLTGQLQRLNDFLRFGRPAVVGTDREWKDALRAIAAGEEPFVFMAEGEKPYEA